MNAFKKPVGASLKTVAAAVLTFFAGAAAYGDTGPLAQGPAGISQDQAKSLVLAWLKEHGERLDSPEFDFESEAADPEIPGFYLFAAYYNSRTSLKIIGAYAVDRYTAAVWQRLNCEELKSESLDKLKDRLPTAVPPIERPGSLTCF
jgi:hypothetical protein